MSNARTCMRVRFPTLAIALSVIVNGCGNDGGSGVSVPAAAQLTGTYDVTVAGAEIVGGEDHALGFVAADGEDVRIALHADTFTTLVLSGTPSATGEVELRGEERAADTGRFLSGRALLRRESEVYRVLGQIDGTFIYDGAVSFTMERPVAASRMTFTGIYDLRFTPAPSGCGCPSTIGFAFLFENDGTGHTLATTEIDSDRTVLATVEKGGILVSPQGRLFLEADHLGARAREGVPPKTERLLLFGQLHRNRDDEVVGAGQFGFEFDLDRFYLPMGDWTAVSVDRRVHAADDAP